ncbi:MAG: tetratricopeptide repeat protein [Myxococcales bacterium]|nr:tetratricopeptide repeat protein [Myxococcales bacterium]
MRPLALALGLVALPAIVAAQQAPLPAQPAGDPAPDAAVAVDQIKRGRYEDAIVSAKRALSRDERYVPALMAMAKAYFHLKKYELSTAILDLVQKLDPQNAESFNILGFIALTRNDGISATQAFKKATELKDDYGIAWNSLSAQYILQKNYDGALQASEKAVQHLPNFDKAHLNLGAAYRGKQMYVEAEREFRKALELNPGYAEAFFNLGILYLDAPKMGEMDVVTRYNTAIGHLAKYKNLASFRLTKDDPSDGFIDEARKGIEREQKRLQRLEKQKERDRAKAAAQPPAQPPAAAPGTEGAPAAPQGEQPPGTPQ